MNTLRILPFLILGLTTTFGHAAAPKGSERIEVIFSQPDNFTDVKDQYMGSDKGRDAILDEIKEYMEQQAGRYIGEGQKLTVTFTDIDMAGDFEPGRGVRMQDVRIVKDIYPPRMKFSFKLTKADGSVAKEGERNLRDMAFLSRLSINTSDQLRHEKGLLEDWFRSEFKNTK